jgi:hypothetical protein
MEEKMEVVKISGIEVTIRIAGETGEWFGVTAYAKESELVKAGLLPEDREEWETGCQHDWYDTSVIGDEEDGLLIIATGGGAPEDDTRWVEGSGWRCSRQTDAYGALWDAEEWDEDSELFQARDEFWEEVKDAVESRYGYADGLYQREEEDEGDDEDDEGEDEEEEPSPRLVALVEDEEKPIKIISGEGERGVIEDYDDERSIAALKDRLDEERCGGDRWAKALVYSYEAKGGKVYVNVETGEECFL